MPINPHLEAGLVISILRRVEATVLVTTGDLYGPGTRDRIEAIRAAVPSLRRVYLVGGAGQHDDFSQALCAVVPGSMSLPANAAQDEAMFMPTGGTTGAPKIVRMTHRGQLPIAYVELKPGASVTPQELLAFATVQTQERASIPAEIIILPTMPLTAVGKISKPVLRVDATARVAQAVTAQVLGAGHAFELRVDDTAKRLTVVLTIAVPAADFAAASQRLRAEFENFEFKTEIVRAP